MAKGKTKSFTPAVGFFKGPNGKTRPITQRKQTSLLQPRTVTRVKNAPSKRRSKKLRIVTRVKTKGFPYSTPRRVKPMLANRGTEKDLDRPGYIAERKYDGTRVVVIRDGDRVILRGRSWKNDFASRYPELVEEIRRFPCKQFVADAELTFFKKGTDEDVMLTALAKPSTQKLYDLKLLFFDVLHIGTSDVTGQPIERRFQKLKGLVPSHRYRRTRRKGFKIVDIVEVATQNQKRFYQDIVKKNGEGVMLKRLGSTYQEHARNNDWLKVKKSETDDAIIIGYTRGGGRRSGTFGSLILGKPDGKGGFRIVGEAGTGFSDKQLVAIQRQLKKLEIKHQKVNETVPDIESWVKPTVVVEVKFHERSKYKKYRYPSFVRIRDDKTPDMVN